MEIGKLLKNPYVLVGGVVIGGALLMMRGSSGGGSMQLSIPDAIVQQNMAASLDSFALEAQRVTSDAALKAAALQTWGSVILGKQKADSDNLATQAGVVTAANNVNGTIQIANIQANNRLALAPI